MKNADEVSTIDPAPASVRRARGHRRSRPVARLLALAAAAGFIASASGHGLVAHVDRTEENRPAAAAPAPAADPVAREMTMRLLALRDGHAQLKSATDKAAALASMRELAEARAGTLRDLVETDPAEVLRIALPAGARDRLPAEVRPLVEESIEAAGEIEAFHVDHTDGSLDHYLHYLTTPSGRYSLHYAGPAPDVTSGALARVRGVRIGDAIAVAGASGVTTEKMAAMPGTKGAQRTLAILVNFSDQKSSKPYTTAQVAQVVFGTTSDFDYEVSYQQTTLTGDVAGWYTIATTSRACDMFAIAEQARAAAAASGYDLASYARLVYIFPTASCSWWGMGSVGGMPSQAWIHTKYGLSVEVVAHETGHNLGLWHAHSLDCGSSSLAANGASCTASEYGDIFDTMGGNSGHYNAYQKERLGWLGDGVSPPLTVVPALVGTMSYDIAPLENARNATPRALKIPRATACGANDDWFYVEARQAKGFDAFLSGNANVLSGVLVRKVTEGNPDSSFLLDMTASSSSWKDAALATGKSFTDPVSGVRIRTASAGSSGARVEVTFPPAACTRNAPAVTIAPSGTAWTAPGAPVPYTVQAQNRDGCGCAASAFDVTASLPPGWSATSARTGTVAPGTLASTQILVTPPAGTGAAYYPVTIKATNASATAYAGTIAATVAIDASSVPPPPPPAAPPPPPPPPPDSKAMVVTASTDQSSYRLLTGRSANPVVTTSVRAGGTAVSGAPVTVELRDPMGGRTTVRGNTNRDGVHTASFTIKSGSTKGTYTATTSATRNGASATATVTFVVN